MYKTFLDQNFCYILVKSAQGYAYFIVQRIQMYFFNRNFDSQESNYEHIFGILFTMFTKFTNKTLSVTNLKK